MKTNRKSALGLLALIILCSCARAPQEISEKSLVPAEPLKSEEVRNSIVRVVSRSQIRGVGNGFFVAPDKIATNIHLFADANPVSVHVRGGGIVRSIRGVTAFDVKNNLVILKVSIESVPLPLGDSDAVKTGDTISDAGILARGSRDKAKQGTILGIRDNDKWFSTTLQPKPDVSGGPILNSENEVIGIEVIEGEFGYAIPSNALKAVLRTQSDTVESFAEWQQRDTIRAYSYVEQAKRKFRDDDHSAMIELLNEAIRLNPEFVTAYTKRGKGKLHLGEFESDRGTETEAQRHYRSAIDDLDSALQLNPESAIAYKNRGLVNRLLADSEADAGKVGAQQHYHAAIADYTQVIEWMPNDAVSYTDRGTARKNLGEFESETGNAAEAQQHYHTAIDDYTQAIKLKPDYTEAYHGRGLVKEMLGQQEEAKADVEKAETLKRAQQATVRVTRRSGHGTGFFVARNMVATNIHVVAHPEPVFVRSVNDEITWTVEGVTAFDAKNDLVLLKVMGEGVPLPLADSDTVGIGESVTVAGYPGGKYTVVEGTIHDIRDSDKWIRIKAMIAGGNSGSPVTNTKGQVIGAIFGQEESYGYIIPSNSIKRLVAQSETVEPLAQWQQRKPIRVIRANFYASHAQQKHIANNYVGAIADYDKALKLNPDDADNYYNRGLTKLILGDLEAEQGNTEKARELYESGIEDSTQAIKLIPEDFAPYHNRSGGKLRLGQFSENQGDLAKAQQYYQNAIHDCMQAIRLNSESVDAYINRGAAKIYLGESKADQGNMEEAQKLYTESIQDFMQAIRLAPENADAYNNQGWAKSLLGESKADSGNRVKAQKLYESAIEDYTQAIQLDSEHAYAYKNRGRTKHLLGESEAATGNRAEARKLYEAALIDCDKSIQFDSDSADVYRNRGVIKAALGDFEAAIIDFDKAIEIDPEDAEAYYSRGLAKEALGQTEKAEVDFEKAKDLNPDVGK